MRVRRLDWVEALPPADRPAVMQEDMLAGRGTEIDGPETLPKGDRFPVIIGSDLLYEVQQPFTCHEIPLQLKGLLL